jgi:penicillin amidase
MLLRLLGDAANPGRRRGTHPRLDRWSLPAMQGRVEIVRDARGVPHVYADHERDLYAALGYLQGADRFVLLDLLRHAGAGRLCALVGNVAPPVSDELLGGRRVGDVDAFIRPLGFEAEAERDAPRLAPRDRDCLEAFADGVNAALRAMRGVYPAEYLALGPVRPWRVADSLLCTRTSGFVVSLVNLENELCFDAVRGEVGDALARRLYPEAPWADVPAGVPARRTGPFEEPEAPMRLPSGGSNNWAVSGARTASGAPIVANDPHVPLVPLPTYWYHAHLEAPGVRVQGGVFPGIPAFGFGHNGDLAWGCTTGFRDAWDLVRIHRVKSDPTLYRTATGFDRVRRHVERIPVRFGGSLTLEWESCAHGVLYPGWKHHDGVDLAVRFVPADLAAYAEGYLGLARARSVGDHRAAVARIHEGGAFDFNHVYAHREGHVAWELFGLLPRRRKDGLFVRDAHDPDAQWDGFVPFEEMPKITNPGAGFVASANSVVDPGDWARIASLVHFEPRLRQERIDEALAQSARHDVESSRALQADVRAGYVLPLRDALLRLLAPVVDEASREAGAVRALAAWDGSFDVEGAAPAILWFTRIELARACFVPLLGRRVGRRYANGRRGLPRVVRLVIDEADPLRADVEAAAGRPLATLARAALLAALRRIEAICGEDPAAWRWGRIQRVRLGTLFAELPRVGRRFVALDDAFPGDEYTVSPTRPLDEGHRLRAFVGATSRFVCDLAKPEEAWFAHSSGPRADVGSAWYANLSPSWRRFELFRSALWKAHEVPDVVERVVVSGGAGGER